MEPDLNFVARGRKGAKGFNEDISGWDLSSVMSMGYIYRGTIAFQGEGLSSWDIRNVTDMDGMFDDVFIRLASIIEDDYYMP